MRSHTAVLRKIAELNLDPKVAHVSDGKGGMTKKLISKCKAEIVEYTLGERLEKKQEEVAVEQKEEILDTVECIKEIIELKEEVSEKKEDTEPVEENIVKKKFPFQKKKVIPTE